MTLRCCACRGATQNEPEFAAPWEACVYTPDYERKFIVEFLGPRMRAEHPDLKILAYDHNKNDLVTWATAMYSDPEARKYVDGMAFHWYSGTSPLCVWCRLLRRARAG